MTVPERAIEFGRISDAEKRFYISQGASICSVHPQKLAETFRKSKRVELSNSIYIRQVIESGNAVGNFNMPLSICDEWPAALRCGVMSKINMKYPSIYMSWVIWRPTFVWWMPDPSNSVLYPMTFSRDPFQEISLRSGSVFRSRTEQICRDRNGEFWRVWSPYIRENLYFLSWWTR